MYERKSHNMRYRTGAAVGACTSAEPGVVRRSAPKTDSQKCCGSSSSRPAGTHAARPDRPAWLIRVVASRTPARSLSPGHPPAAPILSSRTSSAAAWRISRYNTSRANLTSNNSQSS